VAGQKRNPRIDIRINAMETKISGQMSSLGIASEETNPPTAAVGSLQSKPLERFMVVIVLAYA
jgi:hypothetical protein